ncbi:MAG: polysaccharide pyruvyl transferase family protein [Clostridiales bacterium]|nr:polysaccharide pyruvyl transferase family protein [Clostridiales bacterium]
MKNIYIRSGMSPLDSFTPAQILLKNSIGTNVGNLLYVYGILRTITQEDTTITSNYYSARMEDADMINETYDCFIIPLADAFRNDFVYELRNLTRLVRKLKIPCYIIGVGLRAPYEADFSEGFPFDKDVKEFVSAVLEKSAIVGVRGQITSDYLTHLGFKEGTDHMVIGCPSMYTFGPELTIRNTNITRESRVCFNTSVTTPDNIHEFINRTIKEFPDYQFVPQVLSELRLLYTGSPYMNKGNALYPCEITDEVYNGKHCQFFINIPTWLDYLKNADFSFGSRLHGNIAATLSGTPSILFPKDARVRELAEYHHLTSVPCHEINERTSIWDLIEKADFHDVSRYQEENFNRFLKFLEMNDIDHIYKDGKAPDQVPLDVMMSQVEMKPPVTSIAACSLEEMNARWKAFYPGHDKKIRDLNKQKKDLQQEIAALKLEQISPFTRVGNKIINSVKKVVKK